MKAPKEKRSAQLHILISEQEMDKIRERMAQTGITNTSAFIRKMAIDGYVINLDLSEVRELTRLLRICSNNLNQYARKAMRPAVSMRWILQICNPAWMGFGKLQKSC